MVERAEKILSAAALAGCAIVASSSVVNAQQSVIDKSQAVAATFQPEDTPAPPSWGTTATSTLVIPAFAAEVEPGGVWASTVGARYISNGFFQIYAPFHLPTGVLITDVQVVGCDTTATQEIAFSLVGWNVSGAVTVSSGTASTGAAPVPGCGVFTLTLPTPHTVDNSNTYSIAVSLGNTSATRFVATRVRYKLQVKPAPAIATFADVPVSDPIFRFVEALAAAGITGGCDAIQFCPNVPVTRGQMAVFLAVALGLHWPN